MESMGQQQPVGNQNEGGQSWLLIAIAGLGLVLGIIALIVAFNAKSASDDAASQQSVNRIESELSSLVDKLGIAESTLSGEQGKANQAAKNSQSAVANLSNRLDKLEKQANASTSSDKQIAALQKQVNSLSQQVGALNNRVTSTNNRVTSLTQRVNSLSKEVNSGG